MQQHQYSVHCLTWVVCVLTSGGLGRAREHLHLLQGRLLLALVGSTWTQASYIALKAFLSVPREETHRAEELLMKGSGKKSEEA